jgi:hypothetical protein
MVTKTFFRWSAASVLAGALVLGVGYLLRANIEKENIDQFASTQGLVSSLMVAAGSLLFLSGLPGLFMSQNYYSSRSGIVASGVSFMGIAAFHLGTIALYFVVPVLVTHNAATRALMYSDVPPFPRFAFFWASSLLLQVVGLLWIGIKTFRSTDRKLASVLLITGGLVFFIAPFIYFPLIKLANTLTLIGFAYFAVSILRSRERTSFSPRADQPKRHQQMLSGTSS